MKKILFIATTLLVSSQAFSASTPCTQANLVGNYVMYQAAINHHNHMGRCTINIVTGGALTGNCEFGNNAANEPGYNGPVYGTASMNTNCSATANISFDPVPGIVHIDSYFDLQFTPNKESFVGNFTNTFGVEGITNGTRYSTVLPATTAP
ncbi:hypothetical protein [Methylobacter psychrophilus]|uniref:hypothetical protein n=1 Tax=Methylobacter psychrophilus TaxID=96941 RepID=UPI0021D50FBE|nr:hypothetical protein [Methylobacter psychrophilus]